MCVGFAVLAGAVLAGADLWKSCDDAQEFMDGWKVSHEFVECAVKQEGVGNEA